MTNPNDVAFPNREGHEVAREEGLSKREYFAGQALQGLLSIEDESHLPMEAHAEYAVEAADALIDALNQSEKGNDQDSDHRPNE